MYADQGVAVTSLVEQLQLELEWGSPVTLGDHAGGRGEHGRQRRRELPSLAARVTVWGIEENQIVLTSGGPRALEQRRGPQGAHRRLQPERCQVAPDGRDC